LGSASGGVTLLGGGTDRVLSLGSGGIEIANGAGPLTIGSNTGGQRVSLSLTASQSFTNGSSSPLVINNGISSTASSATLTLGGYGSGGFLFNGVVANGTGTMGLNLLGTAKVTLAAANTYTNGTTITTNTTVVIGNNCALGTGKLVVNGGTIRVEDLPRAITNKVVISKDYSSFWTGDGSLTLTGNGATAAFAIGQFVAPTINIVNTAPMVISGLFSLCDSTVPNNNPQGPSLASSANLTISGEILECNSGNSSNAANRGIKFVFRGTGANLTLAGTNTFGEGASIGKSTDITPQVGAGYNTVTVGRPSGAGMTITPFGKSPLFTNTGVGFYLKALEDGLTLANDISIGGSGNNDGGRPVGFDGDKSLTLGGLFLVGAGVSFPNLATGTLTFGGTLNSYSRVLTILGPGTTVFSANSLITGTSGGIGKTGPGTLTLAGSCDTSGPTTLNGGTVVLDYTAADASRLTPGTNAIAALTLGGVDLQLKGGNYAQALGAGGGTTIGSSQSRVRRTAGGTSTIALGSITRSTTTGGTIDFASGVASTTTPNANGTLGTGGYGYATVDGSDWATGGGTITALGAYDSFATPGTDKNILQTGTGSIAGTTVNTLKIATSGAAQTLTLGGLLTLSRAGLLFTGSDDYTITGASLRGRTDYQGDLIIHTYGTGALKIESMIATGNNMSLVKAGSGTLVLANTTNAYAGPTYLNAGVLAVSSSNNLGSSTSANTLVLNGGTLRATAGFAMSRSVTLSFNGGTFQVDTGTLELAGAVGGSYGALNKTGPGTLLLSGNNTYAGPTTISEGTLKLGSYTGLGSTATNNNRSVSPVTVTGTSVLDIAGQTAWIGNFTLAGGSVTDSVGNGALGAYSFTLQNGTVSVPLTDVTLPNASNPSSSINLYKRTAGTVTLTASNLYSGTTFVEAGDLVVNGTLAASPVIVQSAGTLRGTGTLQRTINVEGGTLAPGASASLPGTMTLGRHLRLDNSATLSIGVGGAVSGKIVLSNPDAKVLLANANLSLSMLPGVVSSLTIIDNQGANPIQGTFSGLPEGAAFNASGRRFAITYAGGDGNDVVLTFKPTATLILFN
jgi:autotransporter-associated beta strand protein